ncbi:Processing alpha glucosidase I [Coemansia sp. RSA 455]|nr:Processing alpha glucosidase I [Coemansia sp. RSA 455]
MQLRGLVAAVVLSTTVLVAAHGDTDPLNAELQWGTYRPNLYFGTRPRLPNSLLSGLMWFGLDNQRNWQKIRHSCELGDNLSEYGYSRHNGRDLGEQTMRDNDQGVEIKSTFIKVPGQLGGLEGNGTLSTSVKDDVAMVRGKTPDLGKFRIRIVPAHSNQLPAVPEDLRNIGGIHSSKISGMGLKVPKTDVWKAKDTFQDV